MLKIKIYLYFDHVIEQGRIIFGCLRSSILDEQKNLRLKAGHPHANPDFTEIRNFETPD